jgi:Fe-S cluster assembly ATP-binding protein
MTLKVENLYASIGDKEIIKGVSFTVNSGECLLVTGQNGAGKSTLLHALMGRPDIGLQGSIQLNDSNLSDMACHERARSGVFLAHQSPPAIDGVNTMTVFKEIQQAQNLNIKTSELIKQVKEIVKELNLPEDWTKRQFNSGASGGERKKNELMQAELLKSQIKLLLLDEPDSGLEQSSRQRIIDLIQSACANGSCVLLVTHDKELQAMYSGNKIEL